MTDFYNGGRVVFDSPIEYEQVDPLLDVDPLRESPKAAVDFGPLLRSTAAAISVTAVIFCTAAITSPSTIDPRIFVSEQRPFPGVAVPAAHQRMGDRVRKLFKTIPLSASEKIADPDYGL